MAIQISGTTVIDNSRNFIGTGLTVTQVYAQGNVGAAGSVLTSTGSGIEWASTSSTSSTGSITVCELLVVGGGGFVNDLVTASNNRAHGGAGAGEYVTISGMPVLTGQSMAVVVGGSGSESSFSTIIAQPGQKGGDVDEALPTTNGGSSGGRGTNGNNQQPPSYTPVTDELRIFSSLGSIIYSDDKKSRKGGNDGSSSSGGGGGAGGNGGDGSSGVGGAAGAGISTSITGSSVTYATGGAGAPAQISTNGVNGDANTGNGGSGCSRATAGTATGSQGGSGIVILAYPDIYPEPSSITGTYDEPTRSGWRVYRFTGSGTITL